MSNNANLLVNQSIRRADLFWDDYTRWCVRVLAYMRLCWAIAFIIYPSAHLIKPKVINAAIMTSKNAFHFFWMCEHADRSKAVSMLSLCTFITILDKIMNWFYARQAKMKNHPPSKYNIQTNFILKSSVCSLIPFIQMFFFFFTLI